MVDAPFMLCAGEALTDMIHQGGEQAVSRVGGATWNVARAFAVLGEPTRPLQAHLDAALAAGSAACLQAGATPPPPAAMPQLFELLEGEVS
ncbi:hypothetical protein [Massilia genomosp. 1]|uniref:hypothetical protein n=1 Tax=Massilia genomosp. 1 TaxID=2609280 RepID=UPI001E3F53F5|nr:hypothetical protein [Massilia genomosp. 1]